MENNTPCKSAKLQFNNSILQQLVKGRHFNISSVIVAAWEVCCRNMLKSCMEGTDEGGFMTHTTPGNHCTSPSRLFKGCHLSSKLALKELLISYHCNTAQDANRWCCLYSPARTETQALKAASNLLFIVRFLRFKVSSTQGVKDSALSCWLEYNDPLNGIMLRLGCFRWDRECWC